MIAKSEPHDGNPQLPAPPRAALGEKLVEIVMRSHPNPGDRVAAAFSHSAVLLADPYRPDVLVGPKLLEAQRGAAGIVQKQPVGAARRLASTGIQRSVRAPEARPSAGIHRRCGSSGSSGSVADARRKASSFGREPGKASNCSHRSSSCRVRRKRAKSATSVCFSGGNASQTRMISSVAVLIVIT
jgi:hypothetical protein